MFEEHQAVLRIEVVGDYRSEREEQDDHCEEVLAPVANLAGQRILHQHDARAGLLAGEQDDGRGSGADQQRIDEHPGHLHITLRRRVRRIRRRRCRRVGRRAHARFVGEQPALEAIEDRRTNAAGRSLVQAEGTLHDQRQHARQLVEIDQDDADRHQQVGHRHERHRQLGEARDRAQATEDDQCGEDHQSDAAQPGLHTERALHGAGNSIGLYRIEDEAEGQDQEQRKQHSHPARTQPLLHVIGRPATELAIFVTDLEQLRQGRLDEAGGHSHQGDHPHPEHRARPAEGDGHRDPGHIAGADPCRQRSAERLKRGNAGLVGIATALQHAEGMAEMEELDQTETDGEVKTATNQQPDQDLSPDQAIEKVDDQHGCFLHSISPCCRQWRHLQMATRWSLPAIAGV
ncbi:hypothetical protein D3C81_1011540 [compost metagenome]